jgi:predicted transcriptional regulator of viral defense system
MTININPTDEIALDYLSEGRVTPSYIASQEEDMDSGNVNNRLSRMVEHGYVERLDRGLYELIEDPREDQEQ